ncbi:hypothetical protein SEUBUCD646_0M04550 [Saccharomyces eubayanus]|uniref:Uncharacterized protein n=1 Tax=Saccharomyces eubayanus TaxID=1080349 RepID=A0ABN8VFS3_SACEU|nr:hypothetical protein SEUBUCD650_0M04490 [Saccharomyces eubayanus]CAI1689593.1 hypothetical protein SEUBUCD646_0M04550 [Saccharomyces eubayanus]
MSLFGDFLLKKVTDGFKDEQRLKIEMTNRKDFPKCLNFNRERRMPIAQVSGEDGFLIFPSQQSYESFEYSKKKLFEMKMRSDGIGITLLQIINCNPASSKTSCDKIKTKDVLYFKIFKFILRTADEPPPYAVTKTVSSKNGLILYKVPLYEIYRDVTTKTSNYRFVGIIPTEPNSLAIANRDSCRDLDTRVNNLNLRWKVSYSSVATNDHYKLTLLTDYKLNLLDKDVVRIAKNRMLIDRSRQNGYRFVAAHYTRKFRASVFKHVSQKAHLIIGERCTDQKSFGLKKIPELTEKLACQSLLIHYIEYMNRKSQDTHRRARRRHNLMGMNSADPASPLSIMNNF